MTASDAIAQAKEFALYRLACFSVLFLVYFSQDATGWASVPSIFWMPISVFRLLPGPPRSAIALAIVQAIWKLSLFCSAAGLLIRWSTVAAAAIGFFLLGLPNNFGKIHHLDGFPVLLLVIFAIAPSGNGESGSDDDYRWPIQLGRTLFLLVFAAAGISKLLHSGAAWIAGSNMRNILIGNAFLYRPPTHLAQWISASPHLCQAASIGSLATELAALPAIFFRRLRAPVVLAMFGLQIGIGLTMGIYFLPHLVGYALFIPWEKLLSAFSRKWSIRAVPHPT